MTHHAVYVACRHCREATALGTSRTHRGLCPACWGQQGIRVLYPPEETCLHCRRGKTYPHRRGLCWPCWSRPEVRCQYAKRTTGGLASPRCVKGACRHCGKSASAAGLRERRGLCYACRKDAEVAGQYGIVPARVAYQPTAAEIKAACAVERAGWTAKEEAARGGHEPPVGIHECRVLAE